MGNLDFQKVLSGWITLLYGMFLYGNDAAADVDAYVFGAKCTICTVNNMTYTSPHILCCDALENVFRLHNLSFNHTLPYFNKLAVQ